MIKKTETRLDRKSVFDGAVGQMQDAYVRVLHPSFFL
jgi:hypothetical protein